MRIVRLVCESFRNLETVDLAPHERFNILEGANGQGKTNLLEAIYLLSAVRSFRDPRNRELVRFGAEAARIRATLERQGVERQLAIEIDPRGRRCALDGRVQDRLTGFLGQLQVVLFGPDDLELSKAGPGLRRRFLDRAVFNTWPGYFDEARAYLVALRQRNALLRGGASLAEPVGGSFDLEYARRGARVWWRRRAFLERYVPIFERVLLDMTGGQLVGSMRYLGPGPGREEAELEAELGAECRKQAPQEARRGHTVSGPLADDLEFMLDDQPLRRFGSQGQHRSFVLALKIAELECTAQALGSMPLLLLDDVSSELDEERNALLMRYLDQAGGQVFITTTDRRWIRVQGASQAFHVARGQVTPIPGA